MRFARSAAVTALLVTSALSMPATAAGPTATQKKAAKALITLSQLNLAVQEDWKFNGGGEVEGKVYVGGNVLKTGGADTTQIGFGGSQGTAASAFATVSVGGYTNVGFQIQNKVGGSYGTHIVGSVNNQNSGIEVQDIGGFIKVGGDANGKISMTQNTTLWVGGNYNNQNGINLSDNNTVWVGGNSTQIQGGSSGLSVKVDGDLSRIDLNAGTAQIGGALGSGGNSNIKGNLTALGNISNLSLNANGLTVKSGGSISNLSMSQSSKVYATGSIGVQNVNGGTAYANCGATYAAASCSGAGAAPTAPGDPLIESLTAKTATMWDNFSALQTTLKNLTATGTATCVNGNNAAVGCDLVFSNNNGNNKIITTLNANNTNGAAVINITEQELRAESIKFNFSSTTNPVIINVTNTGTCRLTLSCTYNTSSDVANNGVGYNRNVIWNFVDANNVVLVKQWQGSVIAALANLQSDVIEGSVVAKNFTMTNEIHLGTFNRTDGNSFLLTGVIPEPANWAMMISGFGIIGGVLRRRRSFAVAA